MICLVVSCAPAKEETPPPPPAPAFDSSTSIKDIMLNVVDPSADYLWGAVGVEVTEKGTLEKQPRTEDEWKEARRHALILVEAGNLLLIPGRKVAEDGHKSEHPGIELEAEEMEALISKDPATFTARAKEFQQAAIAQLKAVEAKDIEALYKTGGEIDITCENCHKVYWYPNDPVYKNEKK